METKRGIEFTLGRAYLCCTLALVLTGCAGDKLWKPQKVSFIQDAGAVHLAVLSVAPFDKYRERVQPQFKLSPEEALNQVLPSTMAIEERIIDLLGLKLKVALPTITSTETTTTKEQTGSHPSATREQTTTSKPGDVSGLTAETPAAGGTTAAGLPGGGSTLGTTLGQDPLLRFWTAAALYQEVQLLNGYVQDAAISDGFDPFVVRLQVTLLPWARREPYDAYADISFFAGDFSLPDIPRGSRVDQEPGAESDQRAKRIEPFNINNSSPSDWETSRKEVRVLPLLVTDDIEAALEARSLDRIRQLAFALSAAAQGIGLESKIDKVNEQLESVAGRDYNSAFTVARASHNTLRVRFGAMNQAQAQYSMIPQTHNVTLLLMVPKEMCQQKVPQMVRLVLRTSFVDARDGTELEDDRDWDEKELGKVLKAHGIDKEREERKSKENIGLLRHLVAANNYTGFREHVKTIPYPESLWVDLATLRERSRYQTATLTLPKHEPVLGLEGQKPLLLDDGKSTISTTLVGIRDIIPKKLQVSLKTKTVRLVKEGNEQPASNREATPAKEADLVATSIKPGLADDEFLVTFQSIAAIKRKPIDDIVELVVSTRDETSLAKEQIYHGFYVVKEAPAPLKFELSVRAGVINCDDKGQGKLVLDVTKAPPDGVTLNLSGADVGKVITDPDNILMNPKDPNAPKILKVAKPGVVTIELFNLNPESNITVFGTDESGTKSTPIAVRVLSLSPSKQK